jgi:hypothetical protein
MSISDLKSAADGDAHLHGFALPHSRDETRSAIQAVDRAVDAALRSVPIPDGMLSRLGLLVLTIADEQVDSVDYLGC